MLNVITASPLFGIVLCIGTYQLAAQLQKKAKLSILNPLMLSIIVCIFVLKTLGISYESFAVGGNWLNLMLPVATTLLAVNIYKQLKLLKQYALPILLSCIAGSITSLCSVMFLCRLLKIENEITASLLPKSCTTPIAVEIAASHGGVISITVIAVVFTGVLGAVLSPAFSKIFHVENAVAEGLAIGACSHAAGTAKALEIGEVQGAMSSVAIGVCGIITSVLSSCILL